MGTVAETFARRVREEREARDWTQADLVAALAGHEGAVDQSALSRLESGARSVKITEAVALSAALQVSLADLLTESPAGPTYAGRIATLERLQRELEQALQEHRRWMATTEQR